MRLSLLLILALFFAGCGGEKFEPYGNFANAESVDLVEDAAAQLNRLFPPAKTRFNMIQETAVDGFGKQLVAALRADGYAISEFSPKGTRKLKDVVDDRVTDTSGLGLGYVIDEQDGELRVTVFVGQETISRMYQAVKSKSGVSYSPQGYWARRR